MGLGLLWTGPGQSRLATSRCAGGHPTFGPPPSARRPWPCETVRLGRCGRSGCLRLKRARVTPQAAAALGCSAAALRVGLGNRARIIGAHIASRLACMFRSDDDPGLYLISHASLGKRGLSIGQANAYQMLAPEHRLYIPLSLLQLLVDTNGKDLPKLPSASTRSPTRTLQETVDHLTALTTDSLPLALAHMALNGDGGQGLGLLSGSRLSDIITTLAAFGTRHDKKRWLTFVQTAIPGCPGTGGSVADLPPSAY